MVSYGPVKKIIIIINFFFKLQKMDNLFRAMIYLEINKSSLHLF